MGHQERALVSNEGRAPAGDEGADVPPQVKPADDESLVGRQLSVISDRSSGRARWRRMPPSRVVRRLDRRTQPAVTSSPRRDIAPRPAGSADHVGG